MTHEVAEIRSAIYCSIAMIVAVRKYFLKDFNVIKRILFQSRLSVEETVKTTNKSKKNSNIAVDYDDTQFVCNIRVITELCVNGMNDLATKVNRILC
jgi:hypothetical protein